MDPSCSSFGSLLSLKFEEHLLQIFDPGRWARPSPKKVKLLEFTHRYRGGKNKKFKKSNKSLCNLRPLNPEARLPLLNAEQSSSDGLPALSGVKEPLVVTCGN